VSRGTRVSTKVRMAGCTGLSPPMVRRSRQLPKTHPRIPFGTPSGKTPEARKHIPEERKTCAPSQKEVPALTTDLPHLRRSQLTPQHRRARPFGLGCGPFARRYLGYHVCFLFLRVLRCFSSPRAPSVAGVTGHYTCRVAPFRNR